MTYATWAVKSEEIPFLQAVEKCVDDSGGIRVPAPSQHSKLYYLFPQVDTHFGKLKITTMEDIEAMHPLMATDFGIILPANLSYVTLDTPVEYYTWKHLMMQWASRYRHVFKNRDNFDPEKIEEVKDEHMDGSGFATDMPSG